MKLQKFYDRAYEWSLVHGPDIAFGLLVLFVGLWFIKLLRSRLRRRLLQTDVHSSLKPFFYSLSIPGLYAILIVSVINIIGFQLTFLTTVVGAFSVAAGLSLSGTFQNFAGGVLILLLKPFEIDDNIVAQGQDGKVTSIQIFYTVLITADNKTIIIPNGKLFNEVIVNITREGKRRLDFEVKLAYAADVEKAKQIMLGVIGSTPNLLAAPAPRVGVVAMEIDSIRFTVNVWVQPENFLTAKISLMEAMLKELAAAGIPFPKAG